jgi:hypothetical protein
VEIDSGVVLAREHVMFAGDTTVMVAVGGKKLRMETCTDI